MSQQYRLTPHARQEMLDMGDFVAESSVDAALKIYDALEEAFALLAQNPAIGHLREDLTDRPVKFWPVFSYYVIYDPASSNPLEILSVVHGARDVARLLTGDR